MPTDREAWTHRRAVQKRMALDVGAAHAAATIMVAEKGERIVVCEKPEVVEEIPSPRKSRRGLSCARNRP